MICAVLTVVFLVVSCSPESQAPTGRAGKRVLVSHERFALRWPCQWGGQWTAIVADTLVFVIDGPRPTARVRYSKGGVRTKNEGLTLWQDSLGFCQLGSPLLADSARVRLFEGLLWLDQYFRLWLSQGGEQYLITRRYLGSSGEPSPDRDLIWYRDFADTWNRDKPRPTGTTQIRRRYHRVFYAPVNFSPQALDTLEAIPRDDRPFLLPVMVRDTLRSVIEVPDEPEPIIEPDRFTGSTSARFRVGYGPIQPIMDSPGLSAAGLDLYLFVVILLGGFAMDGESKDKRKR